MIQLRYLNLSGTAILTLLSSIGDLLHLQTLSLSNCRFIHKLPGALGALTNLRHLDISNTHQLKDLPVEIGQLSSLQTLPKIVLSGVGALGLRQLRGLKHLRGTLSIFELQNVVDLDDVKEATLGYKDEINDLQLSWGSDTGNSQGRSSEDVIDLLRPHQNLSKLKIESYRGANFPVWIGDPLYLNLSSMNLINCTECTSLPPLGLLPGLKHLRIAGMPRIKCIGIEFYGSGTGVPFQKLETLRFDHMPGWEKWSALTETEESLIHFPLLHQLTMFKCDKLNVVSPLRLPLLHKLDIEGCNIVLLKSFRNLDSLNYLKVESISGLSHLPLELMQSLAKLDVLESCSCNDMLALWPNEISCEQLAKLRRLVIAECTQLVCLGEGEQQLPCNLEVLELFRCGSLTSLSNDLGNLRSLSELIIKNCAKFVDFPENGIPPSLKRLEILSCNALKSLPGNISALERLEIKECSSLKTWKMVNFPATLKKLTIKNCTSLEPVTEFMFPHNTVMFLEDLSLSNWLNFDNFLHRLLNFSHLFELYLSKCYSLRHFPEQGLPPNLRVLSVEECQQLRSLPTKIRSMTSLVSLEIRSCPRLENFSNCDLPPNLSSLRIWDSKKFKPLNTWGLHRLDSLVEFSICGGFKDVELLGETCLFPPSLQRFSIARFPVLNSISKVFENLTLLRHLSVMNCAKLNLLPSADTNPLPSLTIPLGIPTSTIANQPNFRSMELNLAPQVADNILVEVDSAGAYYEWTPAKSPVLKTANLGAGRLVLQPRGFALPHYSNCAKIGYVIQGTCTVGMIQPNSPQEQVLIITKGDAVPVPLGATSWWFNGGDSAVTIVYLGETTRSYNPGQIDYFVLSGSISTYACFSSEFITKTYSITEDEGQKLTKSQTYPLMVKLGDIAMPDQANIEKTGVYASIVDCHDISAENLPLLEEVGLSASLVRLEPGAVFPPSYSTDESYRMFYAVAGSGKVQIVGLNGALALDGKVEEGEMFVVPSFFAVALIAAGQGMELFSVITSSRPKIGDLGGKLSPWKAMSSSVVQASLNVDVEFVKFFKSKLVT